MADMTSGYTVSDLAARFRVGEEKIRGWIKAGELAAIDTAAAICAKPRYVVTADALQQFERRRAVGPPPPKKARKRKAATTDYYPD